MRIEGIIIISCICAYISIKLFEHGGFVGLFRSMKRGFGGFLEVTGTILLICIVLIVVKAFLFYPQPFVSLF